MLSPEKLGMSFFNSPHKGMSQGQLAETFTCSVLSIGDLAERPMRIRRLPAVVVAGYAKETGVNLDMP